MGVTSIVCLGRSKDCLSQRQFWLLWAWRLYVHVHVHTCIHFSSPSPFLQSSSPLFLLSSLSSPMQILIVLPLVESLRTGRTARDLIVLCAYH